MRLSNGEVLLGWPLERHLLTAGWMYRSSDGSYTQPHHAIDLACSWDGHTLKPVYAAEDGIVVWTQDWDGHTKTGMQSYGTAVMVEHDRYKGRPLQTRYAHLSGRIVEVGQHVQEGELLGYTGSTGNTHGAHLHFEVHWAGERRNPLVWMDGNFSAAEGYKPYTYGPGEHAVDRKSKEPAEVTFAELTGLTGEDLKAVAHIVHAMGGNKLEV